jgi:hypothetical protein
MTMSKCKLDIIEAHDRWNGYAIGWFDEAEEIDGELHLGERAAYKDDEEHKKVSEAVRPMCDESTRDGELTWESVSRAKKGLAVARAKLKEVRSEKKPLEDWELKAIEAGWKPPKGRL